MTLALQSFPTFIRRDAGATLRLLVSVQNADEAQAAISGGCCIVDVKDPSRGSLGRPDAAVVEAVVAQRDTLAPQMPLSVALGEAADVEPEASRCPMADGVDFFKLGTAGLSRDRDWPATFARAREVLDAEPRGNRQKQATWIAVAYADWALADAPAPADVIAAASRLGCQGILIDTFAKGERRLLDWLSRDELSRLAAQARERKLGFALAGRLSVDAIPSLRTIAPDIVGIRSAACIGGRRTSAIDPAAVRRFRELLG